MGEEIHESPLSPGGREIGSEGVSFIHPQPLSPRGEWREKAPHHLPRPLRAELDRVFSESQDSHITTGGELVSAAVEGRCHFDDMGIPFGQLRRHRPR
jgi:hypothetical protein